MKRILIIGNAGSGKTTFALKLAQKTGIPLVHLDRLYRSGNWVCTAMLFLLKNSIGKDTATF